MDWHSFEGSSKGVGLLAQLRDRSQARADRLALPITIRLGLLFIDIGDPSKRLIHRSAPYCALHIAAPFIAAA
jgi:hypothetical protein